VKGLKLLSKFAWHDFGLKIFVMNKALESPLWIGSAVAFGDFDKVKK
jgi:hypothetical protein